MCKATIVATYTLNLRLAHCHQHSHMWLYLASVSAVLHSCSCCYNISHSQTMNGYCCSCPECLHLKDKAAFPLQPILKWHKSTLELIFNVRGVGSTMGSYSFISTAAMPHIPRLPRQQLQDAVGP